MSYLKQPNTNLKSSTLKTTTTAGVERSSARFSFVTSVNPPEAVPSAQTGNQAAADNPDSHADIPAGEADPSGPGHSTCENGGPEGLEPTRYGDWERKGRCIDF